MRWTKFSSRASIVLLLLSFRCLIITSISFAASGYWPTEGWRQSSPEQQGMISGKLADMLAFVKNRGYAIDSITIIRNGYIVTDAYFYPFSKALKHRLHSCTKSITSALVGIAIDQGYIEGVNQPVLAFFPNRSFRDLDHRKKSMTLEHLLTMTSGLNCRDTWIYRNAGLFEMIASDDWTQYVLDLPMVAPPGEKFEYCNGVSYLLSAIVQETTNMKTLDFARKHLFGPLGITDVRWRTSPQGVGIGWGKMLLKPHDMAKIGWLYLNEGRWNGKQIVSKAWVSASTHGYIGAFPYERYGYQWWAESQGYYMAVGKHGQYIFVVPDKNLVAVFTSNLTGSASFIPKGLLTKFIIPAAASSKPLPANPTEKARLRALQIDIAKADEGIQWRSKDEGVAKDGVFTRKASPSFKFEYPLGSSKFKLSTPNQIMAMRTPYNFRIEAAIREIPEGATLADAGPKLYKLELEKMGGTNLTVIFNKEIKLKCGTPAYRTELEWLYNNIAPVESFLVTAFKSNKVVFLSAGSWLFTEDEIPKVESLRFE